MTFYDLVLWENAFYYLDILKNKGEKHYEKNFKTNGNCNVCRNVVRAFRKRKATYY